MSPTGVNILTFSGSEKRLSKFTICSFYNFLTVVSTNLKYSFMFCSCVLIFVYCEYDTHFAYYFVMCFYSEINLCLNLSGRLINLLIKASGPKALFGEIKKSVNNVVELFFHI